MHTQHIACAANVFCFFRHLPDKALDLVDEAASRVRVEMSLKPEVCDALCGHVSLKPAVQRLNKH
jgi:ATP-dependent Clp protease ATP-binding subunit ClpB